MTEGAPERSPGATPSGRRREGLRKLCLAHDAFAERFEGWEELGGGQSAVVIRTHDRHSGEDLALKVFAALGPEELARFQTEVQNGRKLTDPCVVKTYSCCDLGDAAYIEMELVEGGNLRDELESRSRENRPFTGAQALEIARAVTRALVVAHGAGIIHRDVKAANVLLPRQAEGGAPAAKLGDFGISRVTSAARRTATGVITGTPEYCAPEIYDGAPASPASDIYSLGILLYRLFSNNSYPYEIPEDATAWTYGQIHRRKTPVPLRYVSPSVPEGIEQLVVRCLDKRPQRRPAAADVLAALDPAGLAVGERDTSHRTRRRWLAAGAAAVILAAGGAVVLLRPRPQAPLSAPTGPGSVPSTVSAGPVAVSTPESFGVPRPAAILPAPDPLPVTVTASEEVLAVRNTSASRLTVIEVVARSASGGTHRTTIDSLGPGQEERVFLDALTPSAEGARLVEVDLTGRMARGRARAALKLGR